MRRNSQRHATIIFPTGKLGQWPGRGACTIDARNSFESQRGQSVATLNRRYPPFSILFPEEIDRCLRLKLDCIIDTSIRYLRAPRSPKRYVEKSDRKRRFIFFFSLHPLRPNNNRRSVCVFCSVQREPIDLTVRHENSENGFAFVV